MTEAAREAARDKALIDKAEAAVAVRLLDPTSPVFSNVTAKGRDVCGQVRGRNTFGGYVATPTRFMFNEVTQAVLEPDPQDLALLQQSAREQPLCMFDIEYRRCKGEAEVPEIATCMAWMKDGDERAEGAPVVTRALATTGCLEALDSAFKRDIRLGDLTARSSRAVQRQGGAWDVRIEWTAAGTDFSGIRSAGTCVVNANGVTRVTALNAE